jgi:ribose transport system ATP-binding protein
LKGIAKRFPGVQALSDVDFDVRRGEIHGLLGENGAGKSTLIKVITGIYRKDRGTICIDGKPVQIAGPRGAESLGIAAIYQEPVLIEGFDAVQNIFLGHELRGRYGRQQWGRMRARTLELFEKFGVEMDVDAPVAELRHSERQTVAIARALSKNASILIMDEVTNAIPRTEQEALFSLCHHLADNGVSIIYITHDLHEVPVLCDRCTVLRDGKFQATYDVGMVSLETIVRTMVGEDIARDLALGEIPDPASHKRPAGSIAPRAVLVELDHVSTRDLHDVNLSLNGAEILGITGLVGSGMAGVADVLFGVCPLRSGEIRVLSETISISSPKDAVRQAIYLVPQDRREEGLVGGLSVLENMTLSSLERFVGRFSLMNHSAEMGAVAEIIQRLRVVTRSPKQIVGQLSGGNQQKIVIGKAILREPQIYIFNEPTAGVDVGARREIYGLVREIAGSGQGVILISADLDEILELSDRILVFRNGRIAGEMAAQTARKGDILNIMLSEGASNG